MGIRFALLAIAIFAMAASTSAQHEDVEVINRWLAAMDKALVPFLPKADLPGMTVDPYPLFSAAANESYDYKGADSMVHEFPSYIVHREWSYDDPGLAQQMAQLEKEQAALKQQELAAGDEFERLHGAERKAYEDAHKAELERLSKQVGELASQGKMDEAQAAAEKVEQAGSWVYPPFQALMDSLDKRSNDLEDRGRRLRALGRQVSFQIHTNLTPATTAPALHPSPAGTLAGHPFFRQPPEKLSDSNGVHRVVVNLAVYVGPPGYVNPKVKIGNRVHTIRCIVIWAWIDTRSDTLAADEVAARKVLESVDYGGLSRLIEP